MATIKIFHCNKVYNKEWLEDLKQCNSIQYRIIEAIIEAIKDSNGNSICYEKILHHHHDVEEYITRRKFKVMPAGGQELRRNGAGIFHVKFAPTKSVAVLWQHIRGVTHVTFDDHAPVRYHRAIHSFHQLRLGRQVFPMNGRNSRKLLEMLQSKEPWRHKGIRRNLKKKNYL